jgi:DNA-binding IclR family transcriptional regulator
VFVSERPEYAVPALDHALDILEVLSGSPVPRSLTDLSKALHYAPSGLFRLLTRLEKRRYVVREAESGKYSLTLKLFELSHTHSPVENLIRAAAAPMRELAAEVEESVHLSVLSHGRLIVLLDIGSPSKVRISIAAGSDFSPVLTNSGRLLLAHLPEPELAHLLAHDPDFSALGASSRARLRNQIRALGRKHYAVSTSDERAGLKDISVLAGNPSIGHSAALAIACWKTASTAATLRLLEPLERCARRITELQGLTNDHSEIL